MSNKGYKLSAGILGRISGTWNDIVVSSKGVIYCKKIASKKKSLKT